MGVREQWPFSPDLMEQVRWEREFPELAAAEREAEQREELARVRRLALEVLLPAPEVWPRVASVNEDIETQR